MDPKTSSALTELNRAFYARFAGDFARTRRGWPPGFDLILPQIRAAANVLDVGCGNGRLLTFLGEHGWRGSYTGLDSGRELLAIATENARAWPDIRARFLLGDVLLPDWTGPFAGLAPSAIAVLAVLHHIPGTETRARFLSECASLLPPHGKLILSTWQFMTSERLRLRVLPWAAAGLRAEDLDPGDYLLSWGEGAAGQRYCAFIDREGLQRLASAAGLAMTDSFYADGVEGNLNLYAVLQPAT